MRRRICHCRRDGRASHHRSLLPAMGGAEPCAQAHRARYGAACVDGPRPCADGDCAPHAAAAPSVSHPPACTPGADSGARVAHSAPAAPVFVLCARRAGSVPSAWWPVPFLDAQAQGRDVVSDLSARSREVWDRVRAPRWAEPRTVPSRCARALPCVCADALEGWDAMQPPWRPESRHGVASAETAPMNYLERCFYHQRRCWTCWAVIRIFSFAGLCQRCRPQS